MNRLLHIDILVVFFGLGTWLCVNGLFVQLPLLVLSLPEGWNLPSYLTVVAQLSNLGPLIYTLFNFMAPSIVTEKRSIYVVMVIGLLSTLLLANFWEKTTIVGGSPHSTALLILTFFLASVDCCSQVLYIPFMSQFQGIYFMPFFLGSGLCAFVPSIVGLIQGVGGNQECRNGTNGIEAFNPEPKFSVDTFFYLLFVFTLISLVAFILLNQDSIVKGALLSTNSNTLDSGSPQNTESQDNLNISKNAVRMTHLRSLSSERPTQKSDLQTTNIPEVGLSQPAYIYLLCLQCYTCCWIYGVIPSIQSFASLPYGNVAYHLSITLSNMANPIVSVLVFFLPAPNTRTVSVGSVMGSVMSGWILFLALKSPTPPLVGSQEGEIILVLSWIVLVALFTYVRVSVAKILSQYLGKSGLFWYGAVSQAGSCLGAMISFSVVNYTNLFQPYYPCV